MDIKVNDKVVGKVKGGTFKKRLTASKHFLKKPPSIAFDITSLLQAKYAGAEAIEIDELETGSIYFTTMNKVFNKGIRLNRGYGNQLALILDEWTIINKSD